MSTKKVYLKDGRMADLITKSDRGYLVDPYITWNDYQGQQESAPSGAVELVSEVFDTAPVELVDADYKKILAQYEKADQELQNNRKELVQLQAEVRKLQQTKTDLGKLIFNRSELREAKRIILFERDKIAPFIMDGDNVRARRINLSYQITYWESKESAWVYELSWGDSWSNGVIYDSRYGLMFDLTDEEILNITHERQENKTFQDWAIKATDSKWLTGAMIENKKSIIAKEKAAEIEKAKQNLKHAQEQLEKLAPKELIMI